MTVETRATKIWFDEDNLWLNLADGRQLSVPLVYFPRLHKATKQQREKVEISGDGTGLHWDDIDEDIAAGWVTPTRRPSRRAVCATRRIRPPLTLIHLPAQFPNRQPFAQSRPRIRKMFSEV